MQICPQPGMQLSAERKLLAVRVSLLSDKLRLKGKLMPIHENLLPQNFCIKIVKMRSLPTALGNLKVSKSNVNGSLRRKAFSLQPNVSFHQHCVCLLISLDNIFRLKQEISLFRLGLFGLFLNTHRFQNLNHQFVSRW